MNMIEVDHVSVTYILGDIKELSLKEFFIRKMHGEVITKEFKALDDITFHVEKGELLGIIGSNGSGKSTILKVGYTKKFIEDKYDEIIDFAEIKEFEDVAFRKLSSGMKSKIAFSLASFVKPDILILDEVLSVGDMSFRAKSEQRMKELFDSGVTTILVSHAIEQIREMCTKVLWLEKGHMRGYGETQEMCDAYEAYMRGEHA